MKQFFTSLLILLAISSTSWANHACPRGKLDPSGNYDGNNTLVLEPSAYEFDPYLTDLLTIQASLREQGYDAEVNTNSFSNLQGVYDGFPVFTIDDAVSRITNSGTPIRVFVTFQHGSGDPAPSIAYELYAHTTPGQQARNARWISLGSYYQQYNGSNALMADIVKTDRNYGSYQFYGIGVMPHFFKRFLTDQYIPAPDIMHIVGCNTAQSGWENLIPDAGVRCLVAMADTMLYGITNSVNYKCHPEVLMPWTRMNGRGWDGQYDWTVPVAKRLRTAPLSFTETFVGSGEVRMVRFSPTRPLWDVHFAAGVDSMALSPTIFSITLAQNQQIGQAETWVNATFSCDMMQNCATAMVYGTHGAFVTNEHWIDPTTLTFSVKSVRVYPWSEVILRGMNDPNRYLCSTEGSRTICFAGHGPVSPYGHDSTVVVNTTYNDPNYAAAYDGVVAWKDGASTKVWITGTEVGTTRHVIMAGSDPDKLSEVGAIPGSGSLHYKVDEQVLVPGTFEYVEIKEEPDGSTSRVSDVLPQEPAIHQGYVHNSHPEIVRETVMDENIDQRRGGDCGSLNTPSTNDWIIYGPPDLVSYFQTHGGGSLLTRQGFTPVYLTTTSFTGWDLLSYFYEYWWAQDTCPAGATIVASGKDDTSNPRALIDPYWIPCEDCFWNSFQSGDVMWGFPDQEWTPRVQVGRIPCANTTELQNYLTNAATYLNLNDARQLPPKTLIHYGDQTDSGIPADSSIAFFTGRLTPFLNTKNIISLVQRDSQYGNTCSEYIRANQDFSDIVNILGPSIWLNVGPVSSVIRTPGYLLHKNELCASWDGSLLQSVNHPFIFAGPDCGLAGTFRVSGFEPGLCDMFLVGAANKPSAAAWVSAQSGGSQTLHLLWWRLWLWAWGQTTTVNDTYWLSVKTFSLLYPGQKEYVAGMQYLGLPMPWPLQAVNPAGVQEPRVESSLLRVPSPVANSAQIKYSLPELPEGTRVEIACFDAAGRLIRSIKDREQTGSVVWDLKNDEGVALASGVYFVTLNLNKGRLASTKVVVTR